MPWQRLWEKCRRDLWLYVALAAAAALCLLLGLGGSAPAGQTDEEARLARVLTGGAMEGIQAEFAEIYGVFCGAEDAVPCGAVVVAEGADSVAVRLQLTRAVCTLLGLEAEQVDIFKLGGGS